MKQLLFLNIIIATLSTSIQAETVNVFATEVLATSGSFATSPNGSALSPADLTAIVTSNASTFVMSNDNIASIDLGFGTNKVITGAGADLVIFTIGNGYDFGLQVFDTEKTMISNFNYSVPANGSSTAKGESGAPLCLINNGNCVAAISATSIDIFGADRLAVDDNVEIGMIRLFIGNSYNGNVGGQTAYPLFSLAGALHTPQVQVTAVPLPLPALLFSSGLALLGWLGRRKPL